MSTINRRNLLLLDDEFEKNSKINTYLKNFIQVSVIFILGITMLIPFYWMIVTSLSAPGSLDLQLIPDPVMWENYPKAWMAVNFGRGYINSMLVTMCVTFGQVFTSSMAAYAFARLNFPGRDKVFLAYLATMMIPKDVTMIPNFILLKYIPEGLNMLFSPENLFWTQDLFLFGKYYVGKPIGYDSYFALIMPGLFSAYGTFMLRQFFMTIPTDLEDAAKIDGCSYFGIYWRVILPLSKPALATLTTFTFMGSWKEFMWPLVITSSLDMKTLPILLQYFQGLYFTEWNLLMAGSVIMVIPALIMFLFAQRFFVEGIQLGAIKG